MANLTAYQEFLLRGNRATTPSTLTPPRTPPRVVALASDGSSSGKKKQGKNEMIVIKTFQMRLQEWNDMDNQLELVLGSISNLRDRIWWETEHVKELKEQRPWERCSLRSLSSSQYMTCLNLEDLYLAVSNDLLQQERMLSTSRTLMGSMAQVQDGLGRKLDEWMMMALEGGYMSEQGQELLEQAQGLFVYLAQELHRKQMLVKQMLDSCHDGLVDVEARDVVGSPSTAARECCAEWRSKDADMLWLMKMFLET